MGLFNRTTPKERDSHGSGGTDRRDATPSGAGDVTITILGSGCRKCRQLGAAAESAVARLGVNATVEHVTDPAQIAAYGVISTPALAIDGTVVSGGRVLDADEIAAMLQRS